MAWGRCEATVKPGQRCERQAYYHMLAPFGGVDKSGLGNPGLVCKQHAEVLRKYGWEEHDSTTPAQERERDEFDKCMDESEEAMRKELPPLEVRKELAQSLLYSALGVVHGLGLFAIQPSTELPDDPIYYEPDSDLSLDLVPIEEVDSAAPFSPVEIWDNGCDLLDALAELWEKTEWNPAVWGTADGPKTAGIVEWLMRDWSDRSGTKKEHKDGLRRLRQYIKAACAQALEGKPPSSTIREAKK